MPWPTDHKPMRIRWVTFHEQKWVRSCERRGHGGDHRGRFVGLACRILSRRRCRLPVAGGMVGGFGQPERVTWLTDAERATILSQRDGEVVRTETPLGASSLGRLLTLRPVWGLFLTQGSMVYGGYMLLTWLPSYLQQAKGLNLMNAGFVSAVPFGVAAVVSIILGRVGDWWLELGPQWRCRQVSEAAAPAMVRIGKGASSRAEAQALLTINQFISCNY